MLISPTEMVTTLCTQTMSTSTSGSNSLFDNSFQIAYFLQGQTSAVKLCWTILHYTDIVEKNPLKNACLKQKKTEPLQSS